MSSTLRCKDELNPVENLSDVRGLWPAKGFDPGERETNGGFCGASGEML